MADEVNTDQLRATRITKTPVDVVNAVALCWKAADEIDALRARVSDLETALQPFADGIHAVNRYYDYRNKDGSLNDNARLHMWVEDPDDPEWGRKYGFTTGDVRRAAAVLLDKPGDE